MEDGNLKQVVKSQELKIAARLTDVWARWWEGLLRELGVDPPRLLKECIKLRMAVYVAQRDGLRCTIQDENGKDVDLAEHLGLQKPQDGRF